MDWSKFALRLYNRFAREREISGAIANHILQQPAFFLPLGEQRKVHINLFWVRFEVSRIACLSQVAELPEGLNETSQHQYSAFTTTRSQPTTIYDNFRHRGPALGIVCCYLSGTDQTKTQNRITSHIWKRLHHFGTKLVHAFCQCISD